MRKVTRKQAEQAMRDYETALEVLREYSGTSRNKHVRKDGIKYILCEHLKNKTQKDEVYNMYVGAKTRIILCPICSNIHIGGIVRLMTGRGMDADTLKENTNENESEPIREDWKDYVMRLWREYIMPRVIVKHDN